MTSSSTFAKRFIAAAALAAAVLGATTLRVPTAGADTPKPPIGTIAPLEVLPTISPVRVEAGGMEATISFTTSVPTTASISHRPVSAVAPRQLPAGVAAVVSPLRTSQITLAAATAPLHQIETLSTSHQFKLTGLTPHTAYDVAVTATTETGQQLSGQTSLKMAPTRYSITVESITITDDGDGYFSGDGEPQWHVMPIWDGKSFANAIEDGSFCFPYVPSNGTKPAQCTYGSYSTGTFTPRNHRNEPLMIVFSEENFDHFPSTHCAARLGQGR